MNRFTLVTTCLLGLGTAYADTPAKGSAAAAKPAPAAPATAPATPSADEIMQKLEDHKFGKDGQQLVNMEILPKSGEKRLRRFTMMRKDYGDIIKLVTFLDSPADVHGAAFMVWDYKKGDDQRWIYLPSVGQVRRLVVGDSRQSFFGSDLVYEDLTNRDPDQDTHKFVGSQKVDNWDCWVVDSTPKNAKGLEFASIRSWVSKGKDDKDPSAYMLIRQELKDSAGKVVREGTAKEIQTIDGVPAYTKIVVKNLVTGSETRAVASDIHFNQGIPDERFEDAQLSRGAPGKDKAPPKGGTPPGKK